MLPQSHQIGLMTVYGIAKVALAVGVAILQKFHIFPKTAHQSMGESRSWLTAKFRLDPPTPHRVASLLSSSLYIQERSFLFKRKLRNEPQLGPQLYLYCSGPHWPQLLEKFRIVPG